MANFEEGVIFFQIKINWEYLRLKEDVLVNIIIHPLKLIKANST